MNKLFNVVNKKFSTLVNFKPNDILNYYNPISFNNYNQDICYLCTKKENLFLCKKYENYQKAINNTNIPDKIIIFINRFIPEKLHKQLLTWKLAKIFIQVKCI